MITAGDLPDRRLEEHELPELQREFGPEVVLYSIAGDQLHCSGLLVVDEDEGTYTTFDYASEQRWVEWESGPMDKWQEGARAYVEWRTEQH